MQNLQVKRRPSVRLSLPICTAQHHISCYFACIGVQAVVCMAVTAGSCHGALLFNGSALGCFRGNPTTAVYTLCYILSELIITVRSIGYCSMSAMNSGSLCTGCVLAVIIRALRISLCVVSVHW